MSEDQQPSSITPEQKASIAIHHAMSHLMANFDQIDIRCVREFEDAHIVAELKYKVSFHPVLGIDGGQSLAE
jgi:hypothetical protein